jgi:hypothetical protein
MDGFGGRRQGDPRLKIDVKGVTRMGRPYGYGRDGIRPDKGMDGVCGRRQGDPRFKIDVKGVTRMGRPCGYGRDGIRNVNKP